MGCFCSKCLCDLCKNDTPDKLVETPPSRSLRESISEQNIFMPQVNNVPTLQTFDAANGSNYPHQEIQPKPIDQNNVELSSQSCRPTITTQKIIHPTKEPLWKDFEELAKIIKVNEYTAKNIVKLFSEGNTVPFVARYRTSITGNLSAEKLREAKRVLDELNMVKKKLQSVMRSLSITGDLDEITMNSLLQCKTLDEIDYINVSVNSHRRLSTSIQGSTDIDKRIQQMIKDIINSLNVLLFIKEVLSTSDFYLISKQKLTESEDFQHTSKKVNKSKYKMYFDSRLNLKTIKYYQILAINRGESQNILSIKIELPNDLFTKYEQFCKINFKKNGTSENIVLEKAINQTYNEFLKPMMIRKVRSEKTKQAENSACELFGKNLKDLLLQAPYKGCPILGVDPGFTNGCKLALISETGELKYHVTIYPHKDDADKNRCVQILKYLLTTNNCYLIAIGNGTACRETEAWISGLIENKTFHPIQVKYVIVSENGASIYSCSPEAAKEFPKLSYNIISAVSLARRIQDPLSELVKIGPKHLGIGIYQHDIPEKKMKNVLDNVVSECVSFVGVDLNTTSQCLLRRIAGLSDETATAIIKYREKEGSFKYRKELLKVKGITDHSFRQCAGFLRIGPSNPQDAADFYKNPLTNKLDSTCIHPEMYDIVEKLLKDLNLDVQNIGKINFISKLKQLNVFNFSKTFNIPKKDLLFIIEILSKPLNYDYRNELSVTPLFKQNFRKFSDLEIGTIVVGRVENCTPFGYFVDIGVGNNGLIYSKNANVNRFKIGDRVEVKVTSVNKTNKKIGLVAIRKL